MARLGEVCTFFAGTGFPNQYQGNANGEYPFFKVGDISKNIQMGQRTLEYCDNYISDETVKIIRGTIIPQGTVVFAKIGEALRLNRRAITTCKCLIDNNVMGLKPIDRVLTTEYFYYLMTALDLQKYCEATTVPSVRKSTLEKIEIVVPSIEEQNKVVDILNKLTDLISLRKQQLVKLDELVKVRFVEMFGDPIHNTKQLPTIPLSKLGSLDRGRSKHRPRNAPELLGGPYPLIQTGEIANVGLYITSYQNTYSELGLQQSKLWKAGTLCITIAANIAQTAILTFDACFPDSIVGFVPYKEVTAVYMHYWFSFFQKILEEQAPQVAQKNINIQILSDLNVMVPPMEVQKGFLVFVGQVEASRLTIQQSLDKLEVLKKLLMQEYFG